jgi:tRNA pseudouridine65 synthase
VIENQPPVSVLYKDKDIVAFYKPAGFHVHPHENPIHRVHRSQVLLYQARDLIGEYLFPVHRLDAATSGVIVFALNKETARNLSEMFQTQQIEKTYEAVVRGWVLEPGQIALDLELDSTNEPVPACTDFAPLARIELPFAVGSRHATARYSLVRAWPRTGRFHQIRRHFARIAHPLLGDAAHGDSKQNKFFREQVGLPGLCLRAAGIRLNTQDGPLEITAPPCLKWLKIYELFQHET